MVKSIYAIATSWEHWKSPFLYEDKGKDRCTYRLTTQEKVIAVALTILTAPTIIGTIFTFYLATAYFKNRALKQIWYGISVQGKCPTTHQDIRIPQGLGEFRPHETIIVPPECPCCNQRIVIDNSQAIILENCKYSFTALPSDRDGPPLVEPIHKKNQKVKGIKEFSIYFNNNHMALHTWKYALANIKPLKITDLIHEILSPLNAR